MEERVCTAEGCNAKIGGQNHVVNSKNKRLSMNDAAFEGTPGYHTSVANEDSAGAKEEKLCLSDRIMRLLIHSLMVASVEIKHAHLTNSGNIAKVMSQARTTGFYLEEMQELFANDFSKIRKSTGYTTDDASMGLHLSFSTFCKQTTSKFYNSLLLESHITR